MRCHLNMKTKKSQWKNRNPVAKFNFNRPATHVSKKVYTRKGEKSELHIREY